MRKTIMVGILGFIFLGISGIAQAVPILTFNFIGSGQTVSPTDDVVIQGQITNVGTEPLINGLGGGMITIQPRIFNQYLERFPPGVAPAPSVISHGLFSLNPGENLIYTIAHYDPFPIGGNPGDPVELGQYILPIADITPQVTIFTPFTTIDVDTSGTSDFVWTVSEGNGGGPDPIPEPSTMLLLGTGLAGIALWRRRKGRIA